MLTTIPPSSKILPHSPDRVLQSGEWSVKRPSRHRGAQPDNHNALLHGLYARRNPTPLTHFLRDYRGILPHIEAIPTMLEAAVLSLRLEIARLFSSQPQAGDLRTLLATQRPILHLLNLFIRAQKLIASQRLPQQQLQLVAAHPLDLIHLDFRSNCITRDADSFREKFKLSDFNSPSATSLLFLTAHQGQLLEPLLPSVKDPPPRFGEGPGVRCGRPPSDPLPLIDAIFWKLSHHARWQDLPPNSPPMLSCRRYYRRLYLSGRLFTLLSTLFKDFIASAHTDLTSLVNQGCFALSGNQLMLDPSQEDDWQIRTGFLYMQLGWRVLRRLLQTKSGSMSLRLLD